MSYHDLIKGSTKSQITIRIYIMVGRLPAEKAVQAGLFSRDMLTTVDSYRTRL